MSADPLAVHGLGADLNVYAYVSGQALKDTDPLGLEAVCSGGVCRSESAESANQSNNQSVDANSSSYNECGSGGCKTTFTDSDMEAYRDVNRRRLAQSDKPLEPPDVDPIDVVTGVGGVGRVVVKTGAKIVGRKVAARVGKEVVEESAEIVAKRAEKKIAENALKESAEEAAEKSIPKPSTRTTRAGEFGRRSVGAAERPAASSIKFTKGMHSQSEVIARGSRIRKVDQLC